jgi:membrane protease YdiL (CAAX protease family)
MPGKKRNQLKHIADDTRKRYSPNKFRFLDPRLPDSYDPDSSGNPDNSGHLDKYGKSAKLGRHQKSNVSTRDNIDHNTGLSGGHGDGNYIGHGNGSSNGNYNGHGNSRNSSNALNIKWNWLDGLISIIVLVGILVGIYFGTSKIISVLNVKRLLNLNISSIDNLTFSIFYGIQVLLMLGVVWFFAIYWRRSRFRDLGFRYYSIAKTIWYTFLSLILIFIISFVYVLILQKVLGIDAPASKIDELVASGKVSGNIIIIVTAVIAPLCEEVYFRGFLYPAFRKSFGVVIGIFLSSIVFAAAHLDIYSFFPIMIIGWILAFMYEKTKSIFPAIFLHSIYNLTLILILLGRVQFIKMY